MIAIVPTADRSKATVKVRIALGTKDPRIVPEMGVRVAFLESQAPTALRSAPPPRGVLVPAGGHPAGCRQGRASSCCATARPSGAR